MSEKSAGLREDEDAIRVLDVRGIISHNTHVASGRQRLPQCSFCGEGVGSLIKVVEIEKPEPDVVSGGGGDEEGDSTPSSDRWWLGEKQEG